MWFLDVDGVLNTWDTPHPRHGTYRVVQILVGRRLLRVEYSPSIVARINTMHTTGLVEVVWLTSWNEHARTALAPMIGLLDFAVVSRPRPGSTRWSTLPGTGVTWWKVGRILEYLAAQPDRPYIWTDDWLTKHDRLTLRGAGGSPALLIPVPRTPGLTHAHLDRIEEFCRDVGVTAENRRTE